MWPTVLDISRDECKRMLRRYELEAYSSVVTALRAQGDLNKDKRKILQDLSSLLSISLERHRAEVRRAVNDEKLNTIAHHMSGANTSTEWTIEGRRLIPLLPRLVPQTAFTGMANSAANEQSARNQLMLSPSETGVKHVIETNPTIDETLATTTPKRRRLDSQNQTHLIPIKANSVSEPIVVQNASNLVPNHRTPHSITTRTVVNPTNCYTVATTMSPHSSVGQSGARVIFVSTPTTAQPNAVNPSSKGVTAIPLIQRHTLSPSKPVIDVPNTRVTKQRPGRPSVNTSIVGLIGVAGNQTNQKTIKTTATKTTVNATNVSLAGNVTRIPFLSGTQVFAKSNGQQQVVVFPVNSRQQVSVPISQTVKAISIPSSGPSQTTTTTAPTLIYQSGSNVNVKTVPRVQAPNLIIMQQKPIVQTSKSMTSVPTTAITLSKASIGKPQAGKNQIFPGKKTVVDIGPNSKSQTPVSFTTMSDNPRIITKRIQTSPKSLQEMNINLTELSQRGGVLEIDASSAEVAGLFSSYNKGGTITQNELLEIIKKASFSSSSVTTADTRGHQREEMHDSSSEDTVSTSESPLHEMQTEFGDISDSVDNVKTLLDK